MDGSLPRNSQWAEMQSINVRECSDTNGGGIYTTRPLQGSETIREEAAGRLPETKDDSIFRTGQERCSLSLAAVATCTRPVRAPVSQHSSVDREGVRGDPIPTQEAIAGRWILHEGESVYFTVMAPGGLTVVDETLNSLIK